MIAVAAFGLAYCLDRERQVLAGICWAMMMVKPQIALLFVVPLLIGKRYRAICVAAGICLLLTAVSAIVCGRSPVAMILAVGRCRGMFPKCYLLGPVVTEWLHDISPMLPHVLNVVIGVLVCFVLSQRFRRFDGWLMKLLPAVMLCWLWSVSRFYDQSMLVVAFATMALWLLRHNFHWQFWVALGALTLQAVMLHTNCVVLSWFSLFALIGSLAVFVVTRSRMLMEVSAVSVIAFALVSLFPNLSEDVAFPILALSFLEFRFASSRLEVWFGMIGVVIACMLVEMSQWACSPVLYFLEFALLCQLSRRNILRREPMLK
jgi:hypothetical protein